MTGPVGQALEGPPRSRLRNPLDYGPFVGAMKSAYLILTDSGGIQEEAPALGKPVLVLRNETERLEAITEGVVKPVGTDSRDRCRNSEAARRPRGLQVHGQRRFALRRWPCSQTDRPRAGSHTNMSAYFRDLREAGHEPTTKGYRYCR